MGHRVWTEKVPTGHGMPFEKMDIKAMLGSLRDDQILEDLAAALEFNERAGPGSMQKVAVLGFCMGGRIAWPAAVEERFKGMVHAAVPYHGGNVFKGLADGAQAPSERITTNLQIPVLGHFGGLDANPSPDDMRRLQELAGSKLEAKDYAGADHG